MRTAGQPRGHCATFARTGVRLTGKEPMLYPELAMYVSIWFTWQWRLQANSYVRRY
jgi:hypothetical protein